ncbi:hypothetical protein [Streptomyces humidus]|uniref:hypothetical protein n=1 Tax=Streptomyces humidus TaxID=52259 RepID=UPI00167E2DC0|nr:hypothetical protein [Streptomyces humidus]
MTTKPKFDGGWSATFLIASPYADRVERERFLADMFGSQDLLWDFPDLFRHALHMRRPRLVERQ